MSQASYLQRVKKSISDMPALPVTVAKVVEICNKPGTSPVDLNRVISVDPVLMARVMRLINSAYYGLTNRVTSLARAIIMLGLNTVKNLALSSAVVGSLGDAANFEALDAQGFWRHSLGVGVTSKLLARKRKVDSKHLEEYFIAGLMHDIGKIPLNNVLADEYVEVMARSDAQRMPVFQAEDSYFGFTHMDTGWMIAETWHLQEAFIDAIRYHHVPEDYDGNSRDIVLSIAVANYFMNIMEVGFSGNRYPEPPDQWVFDELSINPDFIDEIEDEVHEEIDRAEIFLKVAR